MESSHRVSAIAVGASAGAVEALLSVLPMLEPGFALPVLVVVHIPPARNCALVDLFRDRCRIRVVEADDKEPVEPGTVYFAAPDYHLLVEQNRRLSLSNEEPVSFSRPSIDVLFESAADAYGPELLGVILTGGNHDGARGLQAVLEAGGRGLVQDPSQAYARAMPEAALAASPLARRATLAEIAQFMNEVAIEP